MKDHVFSSTIGPVGFSPEDHHSDEDDVLGYRTGPGRGLTLRLSMSG